MTATQTEAPLSLPIDSHDTPADGTSTTIFYPSVETAIRVSSYSECPCEGCEDARKFNALEKEKRETFADSLTTRAVERGMALLDEKNPGWEDRLNLDILTISSVRDCVLGQLYGDYAEGVAALDITGPIRHGFSSPTVTGFQRTTDKWREKVNDRRKSKAGAAH